MGVCVCFNPQQKELELNTLRNENLSKIII